MEIQLKICTFHGCLSQKGSRPCVRKWSHYLHGTTFTLVTDQRSVPFMFDNKRRDKLKNAKFLMWKIELGAFSYVIKYRSGKGNVAPDVFF